MNSNCMRAKSGASLVEVIVGLFIIIPLFLCLIDLSAIVLGQITNDALAKRAARAAAQKETESEASSAAQTVVSAFNGNGIVTNPAMVDLLFNRSNDGNVTVETRVQVNIPAPVPFVPLLARNQEMHARATEPIVMLPAAP